METIFTAPVIIALTIVAIINGGLLLAAYIASKEEGYEETDKEDDPAGPIIRVPPRSYVHWSEHPPLEHEIKVTPPAGII